MVLPGAPEMPDPGPAIAEAAGPVRDGANQIPLHDIVGRAGPIQEDAVLAVAGDQVAGAGGNAADRISGG